MFLNFKKSKPVWIRAWHWRWPTVLKDFSQSLHLYGFSPKYSMKCLNKISLYVCLQPIYFLKEIFKTWHYLGTSSFNVYLSVSRVQDSDKQLNENYRQPTCFFFPHPSYALPFITAQNKLYTNTNYAQKYPNFQQFQMELISLILSTAQCCLWFST